MEFFVDRRIFLSIGGFNIYYYALFILTGAILAFLVASYRTKKRGIECDLADFFVNMLLLGIVGARLWYCIFEYQYYLYNPIDILRIHDGGLAIQGGIIVGLIYAYYYFNKRNIPFIKIADACMPCVMIAQAIGRWGNFMNQEAYGQVMTEAQIDALHLPAFIKEGMFINGNYYQPTFLYESVGNIIGFILIVFVIHHFFKKDGVEFCSYFIYYGILRFIVEGYRSDSLMLGSIKMAQLTSIVFIVLGIGILVYLNRKDGKNV